MEDEEEVVEQRLERQGESLTRQRHQVVVDDVEPCALPGKQLG